MQFSSKEVSSHAAQTRVSNLAVLSLAKVLPWQQTERSSTYQSLSRNKLSMCRLDTMNNLLAWQEMQYYHISSPTSYNTKTKIALHESSDYRHTRDALGAQTSLTRVRWMDLVRCLWTALIYTACMLLMSSGL